MIAMPNGSYASPYILKTTRSVLPMGGFWGNDPVVDVTDIARMVKDHELRYILDADGLLKITKPEIATWVTANCQSAKDADPATFASILGSRLTLYDCTVSSSF
jgi:hypothetical protein